MELRRAADALLRSQSSPLAVLLAPSRAATRWPAGRQLQLRYGVHNTSPTAVNSRAITTSARYLDPRHRIATANTHGSGSKEDGSVDEVAKNLGWVKKTRGRSVETPSSSASKSTPVAEQEDEVLPPSMSPASSIPEGIAEEEKKMNGGTSADEILQALYTSESPRNARPSNSSSSSSSAFDVSRMMDPLTPRSEAYDVMRDLDSSLTKSMAKVTRPPMRLTPETGRTVQVGGNIDVGRGFRMLETLCARNRVRQDFNKQRFHERPGLKRKRLRRERWRKRFMGGFKATVTRVKQLKKQGW